MITPPPFRDELGDKQNDPRFKLRSLFIVVARREPRACGCSVQIKQQRHEDQQWRGQK